MTDAVLFACGGGAASVISESGFDALPVYYTNPREVNFTTKPVFLTLMGRGDPDKIREKLNGVRVVFVFAMLGGESGTRMLQEVAGYAKDEGCKVVSVVSIPWKLEPDRRQKALDALMNIVDVSDRVLLLDIQTIVELREVDSKANEFFRSVRSVIKFVLNGLAQMLNGPFFTTFVEKVYTFSYVNDIDPVRAVGYAMNATAFPTDPSYGRMIVTVGGGFETAHIEQVFDTVANNTGIIPDIVRREDREDTKVVIYLPVQF